MAEDARVGEHEHPVTGGQRHATRCEEALDVAADAAAEPTAVEVVTGVEPGEQPCGPRKSGQVGEVDQPLVVAVGEAVVQRRAARVGHGAVDEGRHLRRCQDGCHQRTPKDSAASTPERHPSSWKPQPR